MPTYQYACTECGARLRGRAVVHRRRPHRVPGLPAAACARCSARSASSSRAPASTATTAAKKVAASSGTSGGKVDADGADKKVEAKTDGKAGATGVRGRHRQQELRRRQGLGRQPAATTSGSSSTEGSAA